MKKIGLGSRPSEINKKDKRLDLDHQFDEGTSSDSSPQIIIPRKRPADPNRSLFKWIVLIIAIVLLVSVLNSFLGKSPGGISANLFSLQAALDYVECTTGDKSISVNAGESFSINFKDSLSIKKVACKGWFKLFPPEDLLAEIAGIGRLPNLYQENIIPLLRPETTTSYEVIFLKGNARIGTVSFTLKMNAQDWIARAEAVEDREAKNICYKNAIALNPSSEAARLGMAKSFEQKKQADKAIAEYEALLKLNPNNINTLSALLRLYNLTNKRAKLVETYKMLARVDTKKADDYYYKAGVVAEKANETEEAIDLYKKALSANSGNIDARQKLIKIYEKQNQWNLVAANTQELAKLDPKNANLYLYLSEAYLKTNHLDQAVAAVEKAAKLNPKDAEIQLQCALLYEKTKNEDKAFEAYKLLSVLNTKNPAIYNNLGLIQEKKGDRKSAIQSYEKAVSLDPNNKVFLLNLADAYEKEKELGRAIETYEKVVGVDKKNVAAWEALSVLYHKTDRESDTLRAYKELSLLEPKKILWHQKLASLYESAGNYTHAKKEYEKILKLNPDDRETKQKVLDLSIKRIQKKLQE